MEQGSRAIRWFRDYWPGVQAQAGENSGRRDFVELVNCYVADREIRMFPGNKVVVDPTSEEPGSEGYRAFVVDASRPVAAPINSSSFLRERLPRSDVTEDILDMLTWSKLVHPWSIHVVRGRPVILGESSLRVEPIMNSAQTVAAKIDSWERVNGAVNHDTANRSVTVSSGVTSQIRVAPGFAQEWMTGLGLIFDAGTANPAFATTVSSILQGSTYDTLFLSPSLGSIANVSDTFTFNTTVASSRQLTRLTMDNSSIIGAADARSHNSISEGDLLWIDDIDTSALTANQTTVADALANRAHLVVVVDDPAGTLILATLKAGGTDASYDSPSGLDVDCGRCRGNFGGPALIGPTFESISPYGLSDSLRILDDETLTAYWIEDALTIDGDPINPVYASHAATRQRDFGDYSADSSVLAPRREGHRREGFGYKGAWGVPRRLTKRAPYRGVPQVAGDRILVAMPGYGCMWQVPAIIPSRSVGSDGSLGAVEGYNNENAAPRSLGVPKAFLLEAESDSGLPLTPGIVATTGFTPGAYRIAIAYRDDATGEIGQLSEEWSFDNTNAKTKDDPEVAVNGGGHTTTITNFLTNAHGYAGGALIGLNMHMLTGVNQGLSRAITANTTSNITCGSGFPSPNSDTDTWELRGNSINIGIMAMHPAYVMSETMALTVMVFMSRVGETQLNHVASIQLRDGESVYTGSNYNAGESTSSVYGLASTDGASPNFDAPEYFYYYLLPEVLAQTPTLFNAEVELPLQRSMPRGASWVRTVRGVPLSGGSIGNVGAREELTSGNITMSYIDDATPSGLSNPREVQMRRTQEGLQDQWPLTANGTIPPAYAGSELWSQTLYPHPMEFAILDRMVNPYAPDPLRVKSASHPTATLREWQERRYMRWRIVENPHRWDAERTVFTQPSYLVLPRNQIQVHEPGLPSVSLGAGKLFLDARKDEDSVAGGQFRGSALIYTREHMFAMAWQHGAAGALPYLVSSEFGCIAPNAVVEHDMGTVSISERGIVDYNGTPSWGGRKIEEWFRGDRSRFLRDSQGMMRQAFAFWDQKRTTTFIGLTENRSGTLTTERDGSQTSWSAADDSGKSRFPCDTVLLYQARLRAISEWRPPSGLEPFWMEALPFADGLERTCFLSHDKRIRVLDEHFGDENQEPLQVSATTDETSSTTFTCGTALSNGQAIGTALSNRSGLGTLVRAGMDCCIFQLNGTLLHRTTATTATAGSLTIADAGTWESGNFALIGAKSMSMKTSFVRPKASDNSTIGAVTLVVRLTSRLTEGGGGALHQPCWAKAWVIHEEHQSGRHGTSVTGGQERRKRQSMHKNALGDFVGYSSANDRVMTIRLNGGKALNVRSGQIEIELFGGAHAAIQDIVIEAG